MDKSGLYRHPVPNDVGSTKSAKPALYKIVETPPDEFFEKVITELIIIGHCGSIRYPWSGHLDFTKNVAVNILGSLSCWGSRTF